MNYSIFNSRKLFCFLLLFFHCFFLIKAQELPRSIYEVRNVCQNLEAETYKQKTLDYLNKTEEGSVESAELKNHLITYYKYLGLRDSASMIIKELDVFWENPETQDRNSDLYGQYLINNYLTFGPLKATDLAYLDTVQTLIKNPLDQQFVKAMRWDKISVYRQKEEYASRFNELYKDDNLNSTLKADVLRRHIIRMLNIGELDSALAITKYASTLEPNLYTDVYNRYLSVYIYVEMQAYYEARVEILALDNLIENNPAILEANHSQPYHFAKQLYYTSTNQYDLAVNHESLRVEKQKALGLNVNEHQHQMLIAGWYNSMKDYANAAIHCRLGLDAVKGDNLTDQVKTLNLLLSVYIEAYSDAKSDDEKVDLLNKMDQLVQEQEAIVIDANYPRGFALFQARKGRLVFFKKRERIAELLMTQAVFGAEKEGFPIVLGYANLYLSELYLRQGKYAKAKEFATKALNSNGLNPVNVVRCHEALIRANSALGDADKTLISYNAIQAINESNVERDTKVLLAESQIRNDLESERAERLVLIAEEERNAALILRQRMTIIIGIGVILIAILFLYWLNRLRTKNLKLLKQVEDERKELLSTSLELEEVVSELQQDKESNGEVLADISSGINKLFSVVKGVRSFIPELGRLNSEQKKYFDRMSQLVSEQETSMNNLINLNSMITKHEINIRRVSMQDLVGDVERALKSRLSLLDLELDVDLVESYVFLADPVLVELIFFAMFEHALKLELRKRVIKFKIVSRDGLRIMLEFDSVPVSDDELKKWLGGSSGSDNSLNKVMQLKDLLDGSVQYLCKGTEHKLTVDLNLVEIKKANLKGNEVNQLEVDQIYDRVVDFLIDKENCKDPNLSLLSLSESLNIPSRKVSFVINTREKMNFSKFLARIRIEQVKTILAGENHSHLNVAGIGYEAGFNSKSTFFNAFKEFVGTTPKDYMDSILKKVS